MKFRALLGLICGALSIMTAAAVPAAAAVGVEGNIDTFVYTSYEPATGPVSNRFVITGWAYNQRTKPVQGVELRFYGAGTVGLLHTTAEIKADRVDTADATAHKTHTTKIGFRYDTGRVVNWPRWMALSATACAYAHDYHGKDAYRKIGTCHSAVFHRVRT